MAFFLEAIKSLMDMRTSAKMGLRIWNQILDDYDHEQLADNWAKVDAHDHSPGRGVLIPTEGIANGAITPGLLEPILQAFVEDSGWIAADLENTWSESAGGVAYRKIGSEVFFRGSIKGGEKETVAFTLPEKYWPVKAVAFQATVPTAPAENVILEVASTGKVTVYSSVTKPAPTFIDVVRYLVN